MYQARENYFPCQELKYIINLTQKFDNPLSVGLKFEENGVLNSQCSTLSPDTGLWSYRIEPLCGNTQAHSMFNSKLILFKIIKN